MKNFATFVGRELGLDKTEPRNYSDKEDRYVVYKTGPVLSVSVSSAYMWPLVALTLFITHDVAEICAFALKKCVAIVINECMQCTVANIRFFF